MKTTFYVVSNELDVNNLTAENLADSYLNSFNQNDDALLAMSSLENMQTYAKSISSVDEENGETIEYPIYTIEITLDEKNSGMTASQEDMKGILYGAFNVNLANVVAFNVVHASLAHSENVDDAFKEIDLSAYEFDLGQTENTPNLISKSSNDGEIESDNDLEESQQKQSEVLTPAAETPLSKYIEQQRQDFEFPEQEKKASALGAMLSTVWERVKLPDATATHQSKVEAATNRFTALWNALFDKVETKKEKKAATKLLGQLEHLMGEPSYCNKTFVNGIFKDSNTKSLNALQVKAWECRQLERLAGDTKLDANNNPKAVANILAELENKNPDALAEKVLANKRYAKI